MDMKRLEISKLMDEYQDNEFFPDGGSVADPTAVKSRVLSYMKAPAQKKQILRKKKVLLTAALAAVMVLLVGAGFPYIQHQLVGGTLSFEQTSDSRIYAFVHNSEVLKREDGRLYFTQDDGQRIDVTDLISEDTPYIYDGSDPDTGMTYYIVMGGTPESYGWFEWVQTPYPFDDGATNFDENGNPVTISFNFDINTPNADGSDNRQHVGDFETVYLDDSMNLPWLLAGAEQLGITFQDPPENITVADEAS